MVSTHHLGHGLQGGLGRPASSSTHRETSLAGAGRRRGRLGRDNPLRGRRDQAGLKQGLRWTRALPCTAGGSMRACSGSLMTGQGIGTHRADDRQERWGWEEQGLKEVWQGRLQGEGHLDPGRATRRSDKRWGRRTMSCGSTGDESQSRQNQRCLHRQAGCSGWCRAGSWWPCRTGGCRASRQADLEQACRRGGTWQWSCSRRPCHNIQPTKPEPSLRASDHLRAEREQFPPARRPKLHCSNATLHSGGHWGCACR